MAFAQDYRSILEHQNDWLVSHEPAVSTAASASKASAGPGLKNVCTAVVFSVNAVAAQTLIAFTLRDGATGAGTILKKFYVVAPVGGAYEKAYTGLWIPGSVATAMTFETTDATGALLAPVATNFVNALISGTLSQ